MTPRLASYRLAAARAAAVPAVARRTWLITFTDLISLLLAFFVMLFAMSGVKVELWEAAIESLTKTLRPTATASPRTDAANVSHRAWDAPAIDLDYLTAVLRNVQDDAPALSRSRATRTAEGVVMATDVEDLFHSGGSEPSPAALETVAAVAGVLRNISNRVGVRVAVGGDGSIPGRRSAFAMAVARSAAIANAFHDAGYQRPIVAYALVRRAIGTIQPNGSDVHDNQRVKCGDGASFECTAALAGADTDGNGGTGGSAGDRLEIVILPEGENR